MKNATRILYNDYCSTIADLNGVSDVTVTFSVDPTVAQKLETKTQESSVFLTAINVFLVDELEGETVGITSAGPIASRTNTKVKDRETRDPTGLVARRYRCEETDYNTHLSWARLDMWAKFPDFETRIRDVIIKQQALDRIMIGFRGLYVAAESNIVTNPNLEDMNIGWLQSMRLEAPLRVMGSTTVAGANQTVKPVTTAKAIKVGPGQDYRNLDALVFDLIELLDPWHRERTDLVAICGRQLVHDKYFPIVNQDNKPTETLAADIIVAQKRIGKLPAVTVPYFPDNAVLVTTYDNLSIYVQEESRRRHLIEEPKRKRIENYESSNDDYVVEDYGLAAFAENIQIIEPEEA